jgi:hypothetical protein
VALTQRLWKLKRKQLRQQIKWAQSDAERWQLKCELERIRAEYEGRKTSGTPAPVPVQTQTTDIDPELRAILAKLEGHRGLIPFNKRVSMTE